MKQYNVNWLHVARWLEAWGELPRPARLQFVEMVKRGSALPTRQLGPEAALPLLRMGFVETAGHLQSVRLARTCQEFNKVMR
ncbi:MAG: hypothetical protein ACOC93_05970, partial [Planctomycetota bacterium]